MLTFITILYVLVCLFLVLVVLLQSGRGGGMGAAMGGSSQTVFGGAGAGNFLTRLTAIGATLFMLLSVALAYLSSSKDELDTAAEKNEARQQARGKSIQGSGSTEKSGAMSVPDEATDDAASESAEPGAQAPATGSAGTEGGAAAAMPDEAKAGAAADEAKPAAGQKPASVGAKPVQPPKAAAKPARQTGTPAASPEAPTPAAAPSPAETDSSSD
ncbi:MAG: preprotein translocase subunit SecG [Polyangiales bacterium]